jgi:pimeloyl-ACP methyl ester carboxylesterase
MRLVSFKTSDGLRLKGFLALGKTNQATTIHVHGNCGNFYENEFISVMAEKYSQAGINFLCANNRGHDGIAEAYQNGKLVYIGGAHELPDYCIYDIEGAVGFARQLGARILLQGHSFGCLKALHYLLETRELLDLILLSPSDTYRLQANYIHPESISQQVKRIKSEYAERMDVLLPPKEFGIRQQHIEYYIPITARTLIRLFESPLPRLLRYDEPAEYHLGCHGFVYCGGKDALRTQTVHVVERFFRHRLQSLHLCYRENGDHHFHGLEGSVADEIVEWVRGVRG